MNIPPNSYCAYCDSLHTPYHDNNYCSLHGYEYNKAFGNAFYIKTDRLESADHHSRYTIRAVLKGYQHYIVNNEDILLNQNRFLVLQENQVFSTKIESHYPTEAVVIAYGTEDLRAILESLDTSLKDLLDNTQGNSIWDVELLPNSYEMSDELNQLLIHLAHAIQIGIKNEMYYEEMRFNILKDVYRNHLKIEEKLQHLSAKKDSTKMELYKRLHRSKDFMMSHLNQKLHLDQISAQASMSPYHFLRSFKEVFDCTPLQFMATERLSVAKDLIINSDMPISHIIAEVGYDHPSSFSRAFKKKYGLSPLNLRSR